MGIRFARSPTVASSVTVHLIALFQYYLNTRMASLVCASGVLVWVASEATATLVGAGTLEVLLVTQNKLYKLGV